MTSWSIRNRAYVGWRNNWNFQVKLGLCYHAEPFTVQAWVHRVAPGGALIAKDRLHEFVSKPDVSTIATMLPPLLITPSTVTAKNISYAYWPGCIPVYVYLVDLRYSMEQSQTDTSTDSEVSALHMLLMPHCLSICQLPWLSRMPWLSQHLVHALYRACKGSCSGGACLMTCGGL